MASGVSTLLPPSNNWVGNSLHSAAQRVSLPGSDHKAEQYGEQCGERMRWEGFAVAALYIAPRPSLSEYGAIRKQTNAQRSELEDPTLSTALTGCARPSMDPLELVPFCPCLALLSTPFRPSLALTLGSSSRHQQQGFGHQVIRCTSRHNRTLSAHLIAYLLGLHERP